MRGTNTIVFELAHQMALLPLLTLGMLWIQGKSRDPGWWWCAAAFLVSWLADSLAHVLEPWLLSAVYPLTQALLILAVFLPRKPLYGITLSLSLAAMGDILWHGLTPDLLSRTVVWGTVTMVVASRAVGGMRTSLVVYFGGGLLAWMGYAGWPGWSTWGLYQIVRLAGLSLWAVAVWRGPDLRLVRSCHAG